MRRKLCALVLSALFALLATARGAAAQVTMAQAGNEVSDDFKYLADNAQLDLVDVLASPLHVGTLLQSPKFYLVLAGAGAVWGGSFALDQTIRSHLREMSSSDADLLQNVSYGSVSAATAILYGYGLLEDDSRARQYALTAGAGAGVATILDLGIKAAFGRLRPRQDGHDHNAFFAGGASFVSGDVTPMFGLAAGISEYFDNRWYVAGPIYSLALLDGFGRMGHDAHWFSDVVGAGLLGWGTTELLIYLHKQHAQEPHRWRIFPVTSAPSPLTEDQLSFATGVGFSYSW